jgi:hypothetical protein
MLLIRVNRHQHLIVAPFLISGDKRLPNLIGHFRRKGIARVKTLDEVCVLSPCGLAKQFFGEEHIFGRSVLLTIPSENQFTAVRFCIVADIIQNRFQPGYAACAYFNRFDYRYGHHPRLKIFLSLQAFGTFCFVSRSSFGTRPVLDARLPQAD